MSKFTITNLCLGGLLLFINLSFSQFDSITSMDSLQQFDSINSALLDEFSTKLEIAEMQRKSDSMQRADLESKLLSLSTTDNVEKQDLLKQLDSIKKVEQLRLAEKKASIDSIRSFAKPHPVMGFFGDTLFNIYSKLGSFTASERAEIITKRIHKLNDNLIFSAGQLKVVEVETTFDIMNGDEVIMSVSENDAIWNASTKESLANQYKDVIENAVVKYKKEMSAFNIVKEVGLALLVVLVLFLMIFLVRKGFVWIDKKIAAQKDLKLKGLKVSSYTLVDADSQVRLLQIVSKVVKWLMILLLIYITLPIIFGFFPWTQNFAKTLFGYVLNPVQKILLGVVSYLPNLITIIVIFIVFRYVIKALFFFKNEIREGKLTIAGFYPDWANPTFQILRVVLYAFMFILIFPYLPGSDSPIFQGVSVFLGFLFTFGSAGSLSNVIAGIVLTYMRLFKLGDRVKIGDVMGDVIEKSMLVTRIKTVKNEIISIPNSTVMNSHTINYNNEAEMGNGLILHTSVTIGYDVEWRLVHEALIAAADRTEMILDEPRPFVLQTSLDDFYVAYQINGYTKFPNKQSAIYSELHAHILDCCNEMGIEILSPHYRAERDGSEITIPKKYNQK